MKYQSRETIYKKHTPIHVKGALIYNLNLRQDSSLLNKYQAIQEGDKIKFIALKEPNPFKDNVISFITKLPKEFRLHTHIDYDKQFDKSFLDPLRFIVNAIGWQFEKTASLEEFFG
jgi:DNA polymerase elongation subunit (family B)